MDKLCQSELQYSLNDMIPIRFKCIFHSRQNIRILWNIIFMRENDNVSEK